MEEYDTSASTHYSYSLSLSYRLKTYSHFTHTIIYASKFHRNSCIAPIYDAITAIHTISHVHVTSELGYTENREYMTKYSYVNYIKLSIPMIMPTEHIT